MNFISLHSLRPLDPCFTLQPQADSGQGDAASKVAREEQRLGRMEKRLGGLQSDFETTASTATGLFGFLGFGGS